MEKRQELSLQEWLPFDRLMESGIVKMKNNSLRFDWYPKCMLSGNTDDVATSEESFSEQNDTLTIRAMAFDDSGKIVTSIRGDYKMPEGLTEDKFFSKPILSVADLTSVLDEGESV